MKNALFKVGGRISWLGISEHRKKRIEEALAKPYKDENRALGEVTYKELFMKKGGKATISDWVNRMNEMIKRVMKA